MHFSSKYIRHFTQHYIYCFVLPIFTYLQSYFYTFWCSSFSFTFSLFSLGIFSFYWKIPFYVPFSASLLTTVTQFFCLFENCIYSAFSFEGYILLGNQYWVDNCFLSSLWRCFFHCFLTSINSFEKPDIFVR